MAGGFEPGRVVAARLLASGIRNITIAAESLAGAAFEPGADVGVLIPVAGGGSEERRYSVWKSSMDTGTLDVCVVLHGFGPGSEWAEKCVGGDPVEIARSRALPIALDRSAASHLFLGDATSVASAEALIAALPRDAAAVACFEVASPAHTWPEAELLRPETTQWVERSGRPGMALLERLKRRCPPSSPATTAYVTGEAWLCAVVQSHLVRERGFRAEAVRAIPYWKQRPRVPLGNGTQ